MPSFSIRIGFGGARSQQQHAGPAVTTSEFLAAACGIQFSDQGSNSGPVSLATWSLNHWAARKVPLFCFNVAICFLYCYSFRSGNGNTSTVPPQIVLERGK